MLLPRPFNEMFLCSGEHLKPVGYSNGFGGMEPVKQEEIKQEEDDDDDDDEEDENGDIQVT